MCMNGDMISDFVFICDPRGVLLIEGKCLGHFRLPLYAN